MELFYAVPAERARLAPSLFWAGMFTGRMLVSWLAQLVPSQRLLSYSAAVAITGTILFVLATRESLLWIAIAVAALGCAGIWPLLVSDGALHGSSRAPAFIVAAGGLGAATFPYLAGLVGALLGGRLIPALAIPLLVGVFVLVRAERNGSQERMV
jgi:fucose permease